PAAPCQSTARLHHHPAAARPTHHRNPDPPHQTTAHHHHHPAAAFLRDPASRSPANHHVPAAVSLHCVRCRRLACCRCVFHRNPRCQPAGSYHPASAFARNLRPTMHLDAARHRTR